MAAATTTTTTTTYNVIATIIIVLSLLGTMFSSVYSISPNIADDLSSSEEPEFVEQIENMTVPVGRSVRLSCSVRNLGTYKVAWMHFEQSAILTVNSHVITRNPRITVTHDKHRTWYLHINNVQEADRGRYMCQLNTISAKTQFGYLNVVVPPNIDDSYSSSDIIAREGSNVTLTCQATGFPQPSIKWRRDDGLNMTINKTLSVTEWEGSQVSLIRISRLDMGAYLCIASNNVPPSVSKRIKVSVDFPPQLLIPHQLVSVPIGYNVTLQCFTEAHPTSLNYWTREDNQMLHDNRKYHTENIAGTPSFKIHMKLTIFRISKEDFGVYKCVAKNPRGETEGSIRLYASEPKTTTPPPTTASTSTARHHIIDADLDEKSANLGEEYNHKIWHKDRKNSGSSLNDINKSERKSHDQISYVWNEVKNTSSEKNLRPYGSAVIYLTLVIIVLLRSLNGNLA